jgi:hypothetical protein
VGPGYDDANRVVTLASVLLLASAVAAWRRRRGRAGLVVVIGTASMLLGSALEFVVLPLAGGTPDALVAQGGATSPLSTGGFLVFARGLPARPGRLRRPGGLVCAADPALTASSSR